MPPSVCQRASSVALYAKRLRANVNASCARVVTSHVPFAQHCSSSSGRRQRPDATCVGVTAQNSGFASAHARQSRLCGRVMRTQSPDWRTETRVHANGRLAIVTVEASTRRLRSSMSMMIARRMKAFLEPPRIAQAIAIPVGPPIAPSRGCLVLFRSVSVSKTAHKTANAWLWLCPCYHYPGCLGWSSIAVGGCAVVAAA